MAEFSSVVPGFHVVSGFNPEHQKVAFRNVNVRSGDVTIVYLHYPVAEQ